MQLTSINSLQVGSVLMGSKPRTNTIIEFQNSLIWRLLWMVLSLLRKEPRAIGGIIWNSSGSCIRTSVKNVVPLPLAFSYVSARWCFESDCSELVAFVKGEVLLPWEISPLAIGSSIGFIEKGTSLWIGCLRFCSLFFARFAAFDVKKKNCIFLNTLSI